MPNTQDGLPSKIHLWKLPSRGTQPCVAALRVGVPAGGSCRTTDRRPSSGFGSARPSCWRARSTVKHPVDAGLISSASSDGASESLRSRSRPCLSFGNIFYLTESLFQRFHDVDSVCMNQLCLFGRHVRLDDDALTDPFEDRTGMKGYQKLLSFGPDSEGVKPF